MVKKAEQLTMATEPAAASDDAGGDVTSLGSRVGNYLSKFTERVVLKNSNVPFLLVTHSFISGFLTLITAVSAGFAMSNMAVVAAIGILALFLFTALLVSPVHRLSEYFVDWISPASIKPGNEEAKATSKGSG